MPKEKQTIKMWKSTLTNLRMLSALTGKRMVVLLDEMVAQRLQRVQSCDPVKIVELSDDAEQDSPNSLASTMKALEARGYRRVNDPRKSRKGRGAK